MIRKGVRVVVPDQSAISHLLSMVFPIVHVACAVGEDETINPQRGADEHCCPKRAFAFQEGWQRDRRGCCNGCVHIVRIVNGNSRPERLSLSSINQNVLGGWRHIRWP